MNGGLSLSPYHTIPHLSLSRLPLAQMLPVDTPLKRSPSVDTAEFVRVLHSWQTGLDTRRDRPQLSLSVNSRLPLVNIVRPRNVSCLDLKYFISSRCLLSVDAFPKRFQSQQSGQFFPITAVWTIWNIYLPLSPRTW